MPDTGAVVEQSARRLLAAAPPGSQVILFGSHARRNASPDSDLDFLVVEPEVADRRREMVRLREVLRGLPVGVDILVTSREIFDAWKDTPNNILHQAWKEGRAFNEVG
jgi:predicted nucleotidyltransferase